MKFEELIKNAGLISKQYRINDGKTFRLKEFDPDDTGSYQKELAFKELDEGIEALSDLQGMLYSHDRYSLLLIFQAMDAAGKDSVIKHVMSGVNPQGCQVASFKEPSSVDLDHDYLWRCSASLPERGRIGIFNRSYYEEVLVVKVHPEILDKQKLPDKLKNDDLWNNRYRDIVNYEKYLSNNGTVILKFFLNVSSEEQKKRFLKRIDDPRKNWKFSADDIRERNYWDKYMEAYEEMIRETSSKNAPWYVVPADHKWFTRLVVSSAVIHTLSSLDLSLKKISPEEKEELDKARTELL